MLIQYVFNKILIAIIIFLLQYFKVFYHIDKGGNIILTILFRLGCVSCQP